MKRLASLIALLANGCATMEPALVQPDPAIPASWPTGSRSRACAACRWPRPRNPDRAPGQASGTIA